MKIKWIAFIIAFLEVAAVFFFSIIAYLTFNNQDFPIHITCVFGALYFLHQILLGINDDWEDNKYDEREMRDSKEDARNHTGTHALGSTTIKIDGSD